MTAVVAAGLYVSLPDMERQHLQNQRLAFSAKALLDTTSKANTRPTGDKSAARPIFFAEDNNILMYLQFAAEGEWYSAGAFTPGGGARGPMGARGPGGARFGGGPPGGRLGNRGGGPVGGGPGGPLSQADADTQPPVLIDPQRIAYTQEVYGKMTSSDLNREEKNVVTAALD